MRALALRPYQQEAVDAVQAAWSSGMKRPAVQLFTGAGKTVIFSHLAAAASSSGKRPLILVHRDELVRQAADKLRSVAPDLSVGIVKAERNEVGQDITVASVQSLSRASRLDQVASRTFGVVICDEAHHASADSYVRVMEHFGCFERDGADAVGLSATLRREDRRGLGSVWEKVVYEKSIVWGIANGHLADVRGKAVVLDNLDLDGVSRSRGDFSGGSLGSAMEAADAGVHIARTYREHAGSRQGVVFAPTVGAAHQIASDMSASGIATEVIEGNTPVEDRQLIYKRYQAGEVQVLSSVGVLTEGWDAPWASCAVIARPTSSQSLYVQMAGRVLRPWPGKSDALILDVVGVSTRMPLICVADLSSSFTGQNDTPLDVKPGESLLEAMSRTTPVAPQARGQKIGLEDVDLFHTSKQVWLQTRKGIWFVPTTRHTYFLWPNDDGTFRVGRCGSKTTKNGTWEIERTTLELGMAWAAQLAEQDDPSISGKRSSWRRKKSPPSAAQLSHAASCRIDVSDNPNKSELSDRISIWHTSKLLDRSL